MIDVGAATHQGHYRRGNEDAAVAAYPLFLVADGMGGHAAGEVASAIATETMAEIGESEPSLPMLVAQVQEANRRIRAEGTKPGRRGLGTTLTGIAALADGSWAVLNVGDSRVLMTRQGELRQLTTDHSEVQDMVELGLLAPEEAAVHPMRHVITRSLGAADSVAVDHDRIELIPGDRVLVCSDGLTDEVPPDEIFWVMDTAGGPQEAAEALVTAALTRGGHDNITVVVVDVVADQVGSLIDAGEE
ncbi:MAG: protein phosphatase 2C domain-containing protein [Tetrasphaera sp.]